MATETRSAFPQLEHSFNNKCGVTLSDSVEGSTIVEIMRNKPGVEITEYPAMFRIDGVGRLEFDMAEISDALGRDLTPTTSRSRCRPTTARWSCSTIRCCSSPTPTKPGST